LEFGEEGCAINSIGACKPVFEDIVYDINEGFISTLALELAPTRGYHYCYWYLKGEHCALKLENESTA
jgi:hypothetical protein